MGEFLDVVADLEGQSFDEGRVVGVEAARKEGTMLREGILGGFNKAYVMALELGFIEASERYTESGMLSEIARSIENGESAKINQKKKQKVIEEEEEGTERNENDDDNDVDDSAGGPNADFISKRAEKRKQILLNKANSIPHLNDSSVDFDKELRELRTSYRLGGSKIGKFLTNTNASSNSYMSGSSNSIDMSNVGVALDATQTW
jgi:hypothetical protein